MLEVSGKMERIKASIRTNDGSGSGSVESSISDSEDDFIPAPSSELLVLPQLLDPEEIALNAVRMHVAEVMSFINEGKKEVISEIKMVEEYEDISSSSSEEEYPIMDSIQTSLASLSLQGMVLDECEAPRNRRAEVMPSSPLSQKSGGRGGSVPRPGSAMPPSSARSSSAPRGPPVEVQKKMSAAPVKIDIQKSASRTASASMPTASTTPTPSASTTTATITTTTQQPQNNIPNNTSASKHKVPTLSISSANENNQDMQRDDNGELIPVETIDYTLVPTQLEEKFSLDTENTVRPIVIKVGDNWEKRSQKGLLSAPVTNSLDVPAQEKERNRAFDLLDSLSRSGSLVLDTACLHVVIASAHVFDDTLMNVVIKQNINPIEKVERTSLIVASVIHNRIPDDLVKPEARPSIELYSPNLFQPSTWQSKSPRTHESHHSKKSSSKSHHHHHEKGTRDSPRNLIGKKDKKLKDSSGIETSKSLTSSTVSEVAK